MYSGYQDQNLAAAEAEFQRQLQQLASNGMYSKAQIQYIQSVWESNKQIAYTTAQQYLNAPLYGSYLVEFVQRFISRAIRDMTNAYQPTGYGYGMPGTVVQNPYLNPGYCQQPQMMTPFVQPYQNMQSMSGYAPAQQQMPQMTNQYASVPQSTQQNTQEKQQTTNNNKLVITKTTFKAPTNDDNDTIYGNDEHNTSIGTIKVIAMRDCNGIPFKHVTIRLNAPCRNKQEAYNRARLIYKNRRMSHIDIQYDLAVTIPIAHDKIKKVIGSLKRAIPKSIAAVNPLKYLQSIQSIINEESRGVANAIEAFLMSRYNYVGSIGCVSSESPDKLPISSLESLINLSDREYRDKAINAWQAKPGFMEAFVKCVNSTIKKDIMDCVVLDPSVESDLSIILRHFTGLTESDEGNLVDVTVEIMPKLKEFAKASQKEKLTNFGAAGELIAESTTMILKNQHLVYTDLIPESITFSTEDHNLCIVSKPIFIGGYTDDEPNPADTNFEYMLMKSSLASDYWTDLYVGFGHSIMYSFKCVPTTDKWVAIVGTEF